MNLRDSWMLARGGNALMAGLGAVVGGVVVSPATPFVARLAFGFFATACIAASGNLLNDLSDRELDRAAHPNRPLASGRVKPKQAETLLVAMAATGLVAAFFAGGYPLALFAAVNFGLLHIYERWLKTRGLAGNILIALLVASTFLFGAAATQAPLAQWAPVLLVALLAFQVNVAREILKDVEDADADRPHRRTFAHQAGPRLASLSALFLVLVATVGAFLRTQSGPPGWWPAWRLVLWAALAVLLGSALLGAKDADRGQRLLKVGMAIALLAFLAGPLVPRLLA